MTNAEFTDSMDLMATAVRMLRTIDLDTMLDACEHAEAVGPIFHPTEFRDGADRLIANKRVIAAARKFVAAVQDAAGVTS